MQGLGVSHPISSLPGGQAHYLGKFAFLEMTVLVLDIFIKSQFLLFPFLAPSHPPPTSNSLLRLGTPRVCLHVLAGEASIVEALLN